MALSTLSIVSSCSPPSLRLCRDNTPHRRFCQVQNTALRFFVDIAVFCAIIKAIRKKVSILTLGERIKKVRKELDLTQQKFAEFIGSTQNALTGYETGRRNPSSPVINNICKTFNVDEHWLRTGEGEMFVQRSEEDELSAAVERLMSGESSEFKRRLITALSTMKEEHWRLLEEKLKEIVGAEDPAPARPTTHLYVAARDGSRFETEVEGELIIPDESDEIP